MNLLSTDLVGKIGITGAAALVPSILLITFPISIAEANQGEIAFAANDFIPFAAAAVASTSALTAVLIWSGTRLRRLFVALLATIAINLVLWNLYFSAFGPISDRGALPLIVTIATFAAIAAALILCPAKLVVRASALFGLANLIVSAGSMASFASALPVRETPSAHAAYDPATSTDGNVYHIVLDAFSQQYLEANQSAYESDLAGFTFYPNAFTHYGTTDLSMRAVFSGRLHDADLLNWGATAFSDGFTKELSEAGIQIVQYPFYNYFCSPSAIICEATQDLFASTRHRFALFTLIDLVFQRSLPPTVRSALLTEGAQKTRAGDWDLGFSITSWIEARTSPEPAVWRRNIQALTLQTIDAFLSTEPTLSPRGRYTYTHIMLPHDPLVFDATCKFAPEAQAGKDEIEAEENQYNCSLVQLERILTLLRSLDRFENSMIIVHGDHGSGGTNACASWERYRDYDPSVPDADRHANETEMWPDQQIRCIAQPLLLVKPPNSNTYSVSDRVPSLLDVPATILDHFGLRRLGVGSSLLRDQPGDVGAPVFFASRSDTLDNVRGFSLYRLNPSGWQFIKSAPVGVSGASIIARRP